MDKFTPEQIQQLLEDSAKLSKRVQLRRNRQRKYFKTDKGKLAIKNASGRYYWKTKKNNTFHPVHNPDGIKKVGSDDIKNKIDV